MLKVEVVKAYRTNNSLVVEAKIVDGKKVLLERNFGYSLDVDKKVVAGEMQKFLDTYKSDIVVGEASANLEVQNAQADETIDSLKDLQITEEKE